MERIAIKSDSRFKCGRYALPVHWTTGKAYTKRTQVRARYRMRRVLAGGKLSRCAAQSAGEAMLVCGDDAALDHMQGFTAECHAGVRTLAG